MNPLTALYDRCVEGIKARGDAMKIAGCPRVSDLCSPIVDFSGVPPDILQRAADRGTRVHRYIEDWFGGIEAIMDEDIVPYIRSFGTWVTEQRSHGWTIFNSEVPLGYEDDAIQLRGTADLVMGRVIGDYESGPTLNVKVVDFKTSARPSASHRLQMLFYGAIVRDAFERLSHNEGYPNSIQIDLPQLVYLNRDGEAPLVKTPHTDDSPTAYALLTIHCFQWATDRHYRAKLTEGHAAEFDKPVKLSTLIPASQPDTKLKMESA